MPRETVASAKREQVADLPAILLGIAPSHGYLSVPTKLIFLCKLTSNPHKSPQRYILRVMSHMVT